jgi:hypothetical protein
MEPKRDWQALDRKLSAGLSLEEAAHLSGIPLEEAQRYVDKRLQNGDLETMQMRVVGRQALAKAVQHLTRIADDGPRYSETEYSAEGKPVRSRTPISSDVEAARMLAKLATDMMKLSGASSEKTAMPGKGAKLSVQLDLWDNPGNWRLKKPE